MMVEVHYHGIHVANVDAQYAKTVPEALEYAYYNTQNLEASWSRPGASGRFPDVTVVEPLRVHNGREYGHRSSMVGDIFIVEGKKYIVASIGFKELVE